MCILTLVGDVQKMKIDSLSLSLSLSLSVPKIPIWWDGKIAALISAYIIVWRIE